MKNNGTKCLIASAGLLLGIATSSSQAAVIINATQVGGDVVITSSGTINLAGLQHWSNGSTSGGLISPSTGYLITGYTAGLIRLYRNYTGPTSWGTGGFSYDTTSIGDTFGFSNNASTLYLAQNVVDTGVVNSTSIYSGQTLDSLGIAQGIYTWTWAADSITFNAIPEPGTSGLLLAGLGIAGFMARRRTC